MKDDHIHFYFLCSLYTILKQGMHSDGSEIKMNRKEYSKKKKISLCLIFSPVNYCYQVIVYPSGDMFKAFIKQFVCAYIFFKKKKRMLQAVSSTGFFTSTTISWRSFQLCTQTPLSSLFLFLLLCGIPVHKCTVY